MLIALRFVQGLAGAGGIVISRAVVRDLHSGAAAVRLFSSLMLVTGLAPILAPLVGGQLLAISSWEGIFVSLSILSALIAVLAALGLKETLPPERRVPSGLRRTLQTMAGLLKRPLVRRPRARGRPDLRRAVRLHLRLVVRAPGHLRALAAAL